MKREGVGTRWLLRVVLCGLGIIGLGSLDRSYGQTIRKHPLGYTTALSASEIGKVYVPSRYGGVLTLNAGAYLYYTDGSDLTSSVATQIYQGSLEASLVAQGSPCVYTVPQGKGGWYYFKTPSGTSGMSNRFIEAGQALTRPWNGWWWPRTDSVNPNLYDAGGPMDKYDQANSASGGSSGSSSGSTFYQQNMDTDPGWSTEGSWAWGAPTGGQGDHGGADPKSGFTGSYVYGYNLAGGYQNNMVATTLTTTAIDCSAYAGVHLRFRRWLSIEGSTYDHARIQVTSNIADPNAWVTVWNFSGPTLVETSWSLQDYDISSVADGKSAVYIRWVMGPTDVGWTWGGWNIDDVQLTGIQPIYQENLESNPGWSMQGNWAWGVPTGGKGDHGGADPTSGFTGSYVYGYNLSGGYENNMAATTLTTTAIDCSAFTGVHLRFRRWLSIEQSIYDHASVQVTNNIADANAWVTVWNFSGSTLTETAWSLQDYDISAVADGRPAVYVRWVMGPTDVGWTYGGWNIDDVQLTGSKAVYQQSLDSNPGWTTEGNWAWGVPTGKGGDHGGADPTSGFTGSYVYGYNLSGGYENNMVATSLTTTAIDCSAFTGVHLRFRRWLCIEQSIYDHASVQVTNNIADPNAWATVWDFSGATLTETSWSLQDYDISAVADGHPAVYIRWVMGPTDVGWTWGGWDIDDVALAIGTTAVSVPVTPTHARSWEASNDTASGSASSWFGHCWGWSIASILMSQPQSATKNGISFSRDDMEGLYTELADNDPYVDQSLTVWYIPPGPPTSSLGQDVDAYCDDLYRILRTSIREDRVPVQSDMRVVATPPSRSVEVWNQAIYKYSSSFSEAPGTNNERLIRIDMDVWSNNDNHGPPTDDTGDRHEEYIYQLEFDATGQVIANSSQQNWISASHYPPHDLLRLTGTPWNAKNPEVTKARVDQLYQP